MKDVFTCDNVSGELEKRFDPGGFRMGQPLDLTAS